MAGMTDQWQRVTKANPCPVCKKPDYCVIGARFINCMRVESEKACQGSLGGWLHPIDAGDSFKPLPPRIAPPRTPTIDASAIMARFCAETWPEMVAQLAASLGVSADALDDLGVGWAAGHNAWGFPMRDWAGNIIGIRLRDLAGHKWAVTGSRSGLFYTEGQAKTVVLAEGPTDTAAGLSIGLDVIGRPSCLGCEAEVNRLLARKGASHAIIAADNDGPGYRGALKLSEALCVPCVLWVPPCKDLREFVGLGGTKQLIDSLTKSLIWQQPKRNYTPTNATT